MIENEASPRYSSLDGSGSATVNAWTQTCTTRSGGSLCSTQSAIHRSTERRISLTSASTISGYLGEEKTFDRAVARFAVAYADRAEADYRAFKAEFP